MDPDGRRVMILTCYDVAISLPETLFTHTQCYIINPFMKVFTYRASGSRALGVINHTVHTIYYLS